jgi:hypothetical protein
MYRSDWGLSPSAYATEQNAGGGEGESESSMMGFIAFVDFLSCSQQDEDSTDELPSSGNMELTDAVEAVNSVKNGRGVISLCVWVG